MADLYSRTNANKSVKDLRQPNFIRQRHRFKGHRESQKFNLEMDQMRYDLLNTKKNLEEFEVELQELFDLVFSPEADGLDLSILADHLDMLALGIQSLLDPEQ